MDQKGDAPCVLSPAKRWMLKARANTLLKNRISRKHHLPGKVKRHLLAALLICLSYSMAGAQVIFDGLTGDTLLDSLRAEFTPFTVLPIGVAEDLIFGTIDRGNDGTSDGVYCVYTGFFVPFDGVPSSDPSLDVLNIPNENTLGLNIEHTWPQTKGANVGNAISDMHHLYPSKRDVNFARGSLPVGEIDNASVSTWYRHGSSQSSIPTQFVDEYSELQVGMFFEPREDHKGNVARAMFYFYTIYNVAADAADASFFPLQKDDLRSWHFADPADAAEIARSNEIATHQEGKINPYVQDATLVDRAFFEPVLALSDSSVGHMLDESSVHLFPNPASHLLSVRVTSTAISGRLVADIVDILGRSTGIQVELTEIANNTASGEIDASGLAPGIYYLAADRFELFRPKPFVIRR